MKKLSKEAEAKLLESVSQVAQLVADGQHPNDAVIKIASDKQLPIGHVQLVVNAFNTGRTNAHRKSAGDVWERAAEFPLADTAVIFEKLYPASHKTDTVKTSVDRSYATPPFWVSRLRSEQAATAFVEPHVKRAGAYPTSEELVIKKAEATKQSQRRELENARGLASSAFDSVISTTSELYEYFKTPGSLPFTEVRKTASEKWGQAADAIFVHLAKRDKTLEKQSGAAIHRAVGRAFDLISRCLEAGDEYERLENAYTEKAASYSPSVLKNKKAYKRPEHVLEIPGFEDESDTTSTKSASKAGGTVKEEDLSILRPFRKQSFNPITGITNLTGGLFNSSPTPVATPVAAPKAAPPEMMAWELSSPEHENDLRSVQVSSWLQDMMANDTTVSNYKPDEVAQGYNELAKLAPRAMSNPMVAKMMMAKYLSQQGRIDLFNPEGGLTQLLELENKFKQRDAYPNSVDPFSGPELPDAKKFH